MDLVLFAFVYDMSRKTLAKFKSFKYPKEDLHLLKKTRKMPTEADKVPTRRNFVLDYVSFFK